MEKHIKINEKKKNYTRRHTYYYIFCRQKKQQQTEMWSLFYKRTNFLIQVQINKKWGRRKRNGNRGVLFNGADSVVHVRAFVSTLVILVTNAKSTLFLAIRS